MTLAEEPHAVVRISQLFVYPVKSCAGVRLDEAVLTETGLDLDRAWMVVDSEGEFVSQRECPRLALVKPQLKQSEIILRAPGMLALHMAIDSVEKAVRVRVWDDEVAAYDMGDIAAQWFTDFLSLNEQGLPVANSARFRLVRFDPAHKRLSDLKWTGGLEAQNQFSDGYPLLVIGKASLDDLNARLRKAGQIEVSMERFRPNIVLEGLEPQDETRMKTLEIMTDKQTAVLNLVKPCPRCPIPNIDPMTALSSPVVGDMLQTYRQDARVNGAVTFGMNAIVINGVDAVLRVGQAVSAEIDFG